MTPFLASTYLYQILKDFSILSLNKGARMKILNRIVAIICVIATLIAVLLSSVEIAVYSNPSFFEKEYEKYSVLDSVHMQMDDLMDVTDHLLNYMIGREENLVVETTINGQQREFFNDREKTHMVDVRNLFIAGWNLRNICVAVLIITLLLLMLLNKKKTIEVLARGFLIITLVIAAISAILGVIISRDFTSAFITFHKILFPQNEFWILDPNTDLLINIVPEGFFVDMALRIGMIFGVSMITLIVISVIIIRFGRKHEY